GAVPRWLRPRPFWLAWCVLGQLPRRRHLLPDPVADAAWRGRENAAVLRCGWLGADAGGLPGAAHRALDGPQAGRDGAFHSVLVRDRGGRHRSVLCLGDEGEGAVVPVGLL